MSFREYRTTAVIVIAIFISMVVFSLVYIFLQWVTGNTDLSRYSAICACLLVLIAIVVDLSRPPKKEVSDDLKPKGFKEVVMPDEEALKEIPLESRLDYSNVQKSSHTVEDIEQFEKDNHLNQ